MRHVLQVYFALLILSLPLPLAAEDKPSRRAQQVVLISIDGLRPEFYLDPAYATPMLRQLKARGAHAEGMTGVYPTVTYPSHTTLTTGVRPARHGVYYNTPFEKAGVTGRWYWEAAAIEVPTLFSALRADGRKSAALGWPVTVGAPIDWNLPEIWPHEAGGDFMEITRRVSSPGLLTELEREATGRLTKDNFDIGGMPRDDRLAAAAAYLLTRYKPALTALHLVGPDHYQHEDGRQSPRLDLAVAAADRAVAVLHQAAEKAGILDSTAFVIVGDHGHIDLHSTFAPNVALAAAGLHPAAKERGNWRAAFQGASASAFLHLADPEDLEAEAAARTALAKLPPGIRSLFRIVEREELDRLGAAPEAAFALALVPGVDVGEEATGELLRPTRGANHGYLPDLPQMATGFIAAGAGIRPGGAVHRLSMVDVAPLVAELLGLPFPETEGQAPLGFLAEP